MSTILIIDDDQHIQGVLSDNLKRQDYVVMTASSGNEGMALAQQIKPDLVLLDLLLPGDGGLQFLEKLRATPTIAETKVVVMSNLESDNVNQRAKTLGVTDYLVKADVSLDDMLDIIKKKLS